MDWGRSLIWITACGLTWCASGCVVHTGTYEDEHPRAHPRAHHRPHHRPPQAPPDQSEPRPAHLKATASPVVEPVAEVLPQPPIEDPPISATRPEMLPSGIGSGRPPGFDPGAPAAYWIWQGPRGLWRIRTTTKKAPHVFRGHVSGVDGAITKIRPTRNEFKDRMWRTPTGTAFSFNTAGHADGFTFAVQRNGCVEFDLQVEGGPQPKRIFIGKSQHSPATGHFVVCPQGKARPNLRRPPR